MTVNCRLLTLVGLGGMGKTRLAIAAAQQLKTQFDPGPDRVPRWSHGSPRGEAGPPPAVDPDVVLVELDEVKVHAQAHTGRKEVLVFTALVMIANRCWHLAAATARELIFQVGALLAKLGVHRGTRQLLVLADGARWIREWFEALGLRGATMIVCWWHLVKRCGQDLSRACRGREHRREVESAVLKALWHGRVDEALEVLRSRSGEMRNVEALEDLIGYLEVRRGYLPDYEARQRAGLWIASNRVEKFKCDTKSPM